MNLQGSINYDPHLSPLIHPLSIQGTQHTMSPTERKTALTKLQEKQAALATQIKDLKREERKREIETEKQRFAILGRALAKELAENSDLAAKLEPLINARVTKVRERQILGLAPLTKSPPPAGQ